MLEFKKEYFQTETNRHLYPTTLDLSKAEVYGCKDREAYMYKIPNNRYTSNAGNIDFSLYPNGVWSDYTGIKIVERLPFFQPSINFNKLGDITPSNLNKLKEEIRQHIVDLETAITESVNFIDSGVPGQNNLPYLPEGCVWFRDPIIKDVIALPISELYEKFGNLIKELEKVLDEYIEQKKEEIRGPAGAIDNVTASVNSNAGTPKVTVSLSGTPERRKIDLKFENLKGDKPIKGTDYYTPAEKEQFTNETLKLVTDEGAKQVKAVTDKGSEEVGKVTSEGSKQTELVNIEGNKVVEQVKSIVAGNPETTNALTLSGKTRVEFEQDVKNVFENFKYNLNNIKTKYFEFNEKDSNLVNMGNGYAGPGGFTSESKYQSYNYVAVEDLYIYPAEYSSIYFSITVFSNEISAENYIARYRNEDNNLPTREKPLKIKKGQTVVFSTVVSEPNFIIATTETKFGLTLSEKVVLGNKQIEQINQKLIPPLLTKVEKNRIDISNLKTEEFSISENTIQLTFVGEGYTNSTGFVPAKGYKSYSYVASVNAVIYPAEYSSGYFSITVFSNEISAENYIARYREDDGNLPTKINPLKVERGQMIVFSVVPADKVFLIKTDSTQFGVELSEKVILGNKQIEQINNMIKHITDVKKIKRENDDIYITTKNAIYCLKHIINNDINVDCYRVYICKFKDGTVIWDGSDADGVVKLSGEEDFLGGLHGDEKTTLFKLFIDGVEVNEVNFMEKDYNEVTVYCESIIYNCNTTTEAFKRYKVLTFNENGFRIQNRWVASKQLEVVTAYMGMLSVNRKIDGVTDLITGYNVNPIFKICGAREETVFTGAEQEVVMHTTKGDLKIKNNRNSKNYGSVTNYNAPAERLKVYMDLLSEKTKLNQNDTLIGDFTITI